MQNSTTTPTNLSKPEQLLTKIQGLKDNLKTLIKQSAKLDDTLYDLTTDRYNYDEIAKYEGTLLTHILNIDSEIDSEKNGLLELIAAYNAFSGIYKYYMQYNKAYIPLNVVNNAYFDSTFISDFKRLVYSCELTEMNASSSGEQPEVVDTAVIRVYNKFSLEAAQAVTEVMDDLYKELSQDRNFVETYLGSWSSKAILLYIKHGKEDIERRVRVSAQACQTQVTNFFNGVTKTLLNDYQNIQVEINRFNEKIKEITQELKENKVNDIDTTIEQLIKQYSTLKENIGNSISACQTQFDSLKQKFPTAPWEKVDSKKFSVSTEDVLSEAFQNDLSSLTLVRLLGEKKHGTDTSEMLYIGGFKSLSEQTIQPDNLEQLKANWQALKVKLSVDKEQLEKGDVTYSYITLNPDLKKHNELYELLGIVKNLYLQEAPFVAIDDFKNAIANALEKADAKLGQISSLEKQQAAADAAAAKLKKISDEPTDDVSSSITQNKTENLTNEDVLFTSNVYKGGKDRALEPKVVPVPLAVEASNKQSDSSRKPTALGVLPQLKFGAHDDGGGKNAAWEHANTQFSNLLNQPAKDHGTPINDTAAFFTDKQPSFNLRHKYNSYASANSELKGIEEALKKLYQPINEPAVNNEDYNNKKEEYDRQHITLVKCRDNFISWLSAYQAESTGPLKDAVTTIQSTLHEKIKEQSRQFKWFKQQIRILSNNNFVQYFKQNACENFDGIITKMAESIDSKIQAQEKNNLNDRGFGYALRTVALTITSKLPGLKKLNKWVEETFATEGEKKVKALQAKQEAFNKAVKTLRENLQDEKNDINTLLEKISSFQKEFSTLASLSSKPFYGNNLPIKPSTKPFYEDYAYYSNKSLKVPATNPLHPEADKFPDWVGEQATQSASDNATNTYMFGNSLN